MMYHSWIMNYDFLQCCCRWKNKNGKCDINNNNAMHADVAIHDKSIPAVVTMTTYETILNIIDHRSVLYLILLQILLDDQQYTA